MAQEPYASAPRVSWIVDNGSSRAGKASNRRLEGAWENLRLIYLPYDAKDFPYLAALAERIIGFQAHWQPVEPFNWLDALMARLAEREPQPRLAA